jgi:hypothetical protein
MKDHVVAAALGALLLACGPSFAQSGGTAGPVKPGDVRVTTRAPESDKWDSSVAANGARRIFKCKPLACPDPQSVSFTFQKSPTKTPDSKALERFATVDLPKSIRAASAARAVLSDSVEKIETLASKTTTLKGYPSVFNETKITRGEESVYYHTDIIFSGPIMIRVESVSPNRELAAKALTEFVEVMQIIEGPPLPPPGRSIPGVPGTRTQTL